MNYHEKVMAYAEVLQVFSPDQKLLYETLSNKIDSYSVTGTSAKELAYWTEVLGRMCRRVWFKEIDELVAVEKKNLNNVSDYPDITAINRNGGTRLWIKTLDVFYDEVARVLDYQRDYGIYEKPTENSRFDSCYRSLKFLNDAVNSDKSISELFAYIPLSLWSIENLLVTKNYHPDFAEVITVSLIPLLRAHHCAVLEFLDLVNNEEPFPAEEKGVSSSSIFTRQYKPEVLEFRVPLDPRDSSPNKAVSDPFLDEYSRALRAFVEDDLPLSAMVDEWKKQQFLAPLTHIHRLFLHMDILGCTDDYLPVISPSLLRGVWQKLNVHRKVYREEHLLACCILPVDNILNEFGSSPYLELYQTRYGLALEQLEQKLRALLDEGLISVAGYSKTLDYAKARGDAYGLYKYL